MDKVEALLGMVLFLIVAALIASPSGLTGDIAKTGSAVSKSSAWPAEIYAEPEQPFPWEAVTLAVAPVDPSATVAWDLGDGTSETGRIVYHVFREGAYAVKVSVTVCKGLVFCETRQLTRQIEVLPSPFT